MKVFDVKWTELEGVPVLTIPNSPFAALPATARRNAKTYVCFDMRTREELCQVRKSEVNAWLCSAARSVDIAPTLDYDTWRAAR